MKKCAFSIMVNDSIADEVQRIHKLKERPIVVRSTPNYWEIDESVCQQRRSEFMSAFSEMGGVSYLIMYHGGVMNGRGIERLIEAISKLQDVGLVILGNGTDSYLSSLKEMARVNDVENKVLFLPAVPISELWQYVGAVDVSLMMIQPTAKSYYFALPNKFFESVQALTPIVASDFPEMKRLIEKYEIGLTCDPTDIDAINSCVERMRTDKTFYTRCKENLKVAKQDLCWENEKEVLKAAYAKVMTR